MFVLGAICIISDPNVNKTVTFFELFLDVYIVCLLLSLIPHRISKILEFFLYVVLYTIAVVDLFLIVRLGAPITPTFIQMVLETDKSEATEAMSYISIDSLFSPVLLVLGLIVVHIICCFYRFENKLQLPSITAIVALVLLVISVVIP